MRQEQLGLCCYCESELSASDSHIEHMEPRSHNNARCYDHANLAVSCNGGGAQHCGHFKDDRKKNPKYSWDANHFSAPHHSSTSALFTYNPIAGMVEAAQAPALSADYLIGYLGLNCSRLSERRKRHAALLIDTLGDQPDSAVVAWLRQDYLHPAANGDLKQFYSLSKAILEP